MLQLAVRQSEANLSLTGALLLYGDRRAAEPSPALVTIHTVADLNGRPSIMAGRLLNESDLVTIVKGVTSARKVIQTEWMDGKILARGTDRIIWWTAPTKRAMFFSKSSYNERTFDGSASCPVPGLVWMARPNDGLYVFAFKGAHRPTQATELYQAPLFNVWGRGKVCVGSATLPSEDGAANPDAWEAVLFGSRFTHPNFSEEDRLVKGVAPTTFWKQMVTKPAKTFPENRLVKVPLQVGQLLERDVVDTLNGWKRPQGEF